MPDFTASQVKQYVDALENDQNHLKMREAITSRHEVVNMNKDPDLADHFTRGIATSMPSPLIIWLAANIAADILPYPTIPTVTPLGDTTIPAGEKADKLEKWIATWRATVDEGRRITSDTHDNQLLTGPAVMLMRCGDPDSDFPWSIETPAYDTVFYPIEKAPFRPTVMGMRYKQLVRTLEDPKKGLTQRKQYDKAAGSWTGAPSNQMWKDKKWVPAGDSVKPDGPIRLSEAGPFEVCEVYELHIDGMIYIVGMDGKNDQGQMLWQGKSMTGGVSAIVVPGHYSAVGPSSERIQPVLWPAIQMVHLLNRIRSMRATRSENVKPDVFIERTPEMVKANSTAGQLAEGQTASMENGGPNVIYVNGKPYPWATQDDPDLDKLEQSIKEELNRYINAMTEVSDSEVVRDSTANAFLTNLESRKRQRAPMLAHLDWAWKELAKMALHSIGEYNKPFDVYSHTGDEYKDAQKGEKQQITPEDVQDWEDSFFLLMETKSTTPAESRARVQDWAYNKELGLATMRQGITAAGETDEMAQIKALAVEAGIRTLADVVAQQAAQAAQERIRLRAGVILPIVPPPAVQAGGSPAGAAPANTQSAGVASNGMEPMRTAVVPGPAGGSGGMA